MPNQSQHLDGRRVRFRQGLRADLPTLRIGEPSFCVDDFTLWIGSSDGNKLINLTGGGTVPNGSISFDKLDTNLQNRINEFIKLNDIPIASINQLGLVKVGENIDVNDGTISVKEASTFDKGVVKLNDTVTSESVNEAATARSVKEAYDKAVEALNTGGGETPTNLATVATTGDYNDLINKPLLGSASLLDTGLEEGNVPIIGSDGKLDSSILPTTSGGGTSDLILGETETTAYRGDRGKIAYDHSQTEHAPSNAQKNSDITKDEIESKLTGEITSHTHTKASVGLDNVDNTSDLDKPISTAMQSALDSKGTVKSVNNITPDSNGNVTISTGGGGSQGLDEHINDNENPHNVTKSQVGLSNVDNTSDINKPISTAVQNALNDKVTKVTGKGLSSEDFTTIMKDKLAGIAENANYVIVEDSLTSASKVNAVSVNKVKELRDEIDNLTSLQQTVTTHLDKDNEEAHEIDNIIGLREELDDVNSIISSMVSGAPKGVYISLTDLMNAHPNGTSGVFLTTDNGHWYYWDTSVSDWVSGGLYQSQGIADESITPRKIFGSTPVSGFNLFDKDSAGNINGHFLMANDGSRVAASGYVVTHLIPVSPSDKIVATVASSEVACFYDANGAFVIGLNDGNIIQQKPITVPNVSSIRYMRYNLKTSAVPPDEIMIVHGDTLPVEYVPYNGAAKHTIDWLELDSKSIHPTKLQGVRKVYENLFNPDATDNEDGKVISSTTGIAVSNSTIFLTGYIPVEPLSQYTISNGNLMDVCAFFDKNKIFIGGISKENSSLDAVSYVLNTPVNTSYVRINIRKSATPVSTYLVVAGNEPLDGGSGKYTLDWLYMPSSESYELNRFAGKKLLVSGDSITEKNFRATKNWHDFLKDWLSFDVVKNDGKSGTGLIRPNAGAQGMFYRVDNWDVTYGDFDMILIMGNMNDGGLGSTDFPLGNFTDTVATQSQYGVLHAMIQKLLTKYPNKPIGWIISQPRLVSYENQSSSHGWGTDSWFEPYAEAILKVCSHYSIPCLDLYHNSGLRPWIPANNALYFSEPNTPNGDGVHPNTLGQEVMAQKIHEFVKQYL